MNTNTATIRRAFAAAVATTAFFGFAACGNETVAPATGSSTVEKSEKAEPSAPRTNRGKIDFGDDYGTATQPKQRRDTWKGSGNRMDFGEDG